MTNTNWQSYSPEVTHGLHACRSPASPCRTSSPPRSASPSPSRSCAASPPAAPAPIGNFWVDLDSRDACASCCRSSVVAAIVLIVGGVDPELQRVPARHDDRRCDARRSRAARSPRRRRSRSSAPTAAASSTPTPRTRSRTRRRGRTSFEIFLLLLIPFALPRTFGKMVGDNRQGYAILAAMGTIFAGHRCSRSTCSSCSAGGTAPQLAGGAMEGKEQRFGDPRLDAVRHVHDPDVDRRRQLDARQLHAARRHDGDAQHDARRGRARRRRRPGSTACSIIAVIAVFVAGLMVGRTPEYLGKKIGPREIKLASLYILTTPALVLARHRAQLRDPGGRGRRSRRSRSGTPGPHGFSRGALRVHLGREQQRLGVRRDSPPTRRGSTRRSASRCSSAGSCRSCSCSRSPARSPRRSKVPATAGTLPTHRPLFVGLLVVGTVVIVTALTYFPVLALGPLAEGLALTMSTLTDTASPTPPAHAPPEAARRAHSARRSSSRRCPAPSASSNPKRHVAQPRHVHRRGRRRAHDGPRDRRAVPRRADRAAQPSRSRFTWAIAIWLWLTVLFANLAESVAEGRGKAQAASLRKTRTTTDRATASPPTTRRRTRLPPNAPSVRGRLGRSAPRRRRGRDRGRADPRRRRHRLGHRVRRRVGDHRRVRPGRARVRRRPQRGHRRHPRALRPHRRADHHASPARRSSTG